MNRPAAIETIDWLEGFGNFSTGRFSSPTTVRLSAIWRRALFHDDRGKLVTYQGITTSTCWKKEALASGRICEMPGWIANWRRKDVIRQGIKARIPVMKARAAPCEAMRRERGERREVMGTAKMQVERAAAPVRSFSKWKTFATRLTVSNW